MNKIKNITIALAHSIRNTVRSVWRYFKQQHETLQKERELLQKHQQKELQNAYFYDLMSELAISVFPIVQSLSYRGIAHLTRPADMRIADYRIINGTPVYMYELSKQSSDRIPACILLDAKSAIMQDIRRYQHDLLSQEDAIVVQQVYPFIYYGVYIHKIIDSGTTIRLYITSHYLP